MFLLLVSFSALLPLGGDALCLFVAEKYLRKFKKSPREVTTSTCGQYWNGGVCRPTTVGTPSTHYNDVIMTTMVSHITSLTVVYSTVYSDADQRKHQSSASLAFVWGIHRDRWISRTKGQLRGKSFHLMTSSWITTTRKLIWGAHQLWWNVLSGDWYGVLFSFSWYFQISFTYIINLAYPLKPSMTMTYMSS